MLIISFIATVMAYIIGAIGLIYIHILEPIYIRIGPAGVFCLILFILLIKEKLCINTLNSSKSQNTCGES